MALCEERCNPLQAKPTTAEFAKDTHNLNLFCSEVYIWEVTFTILSLQNVHRSKEWGLIPTASTLQLLQSLPTDE